MVAETTAQLFGFYFFLLHVSYSKERFCFNHVWFGATMHRCRGERRRHKRSLSPILTHSSRIHSRCGAAGCISGMSMGREEVSGSIPLRWGPVTRDNIFPLLLAHKLKHWCQICRWPGCAHEPRTVKGMIEDAEVLRWLGEQICPLPLPQDCYLRQKTIFF